MKHAYLLLSLALLALSHWTGLHAEQLLLQREDKRPAECRTIDPCDFTSPAITLARPDTADTSASSEPADVWFKCRLDTSGRVLELGLVWCSSDDSTFVIAARNKMNETQFSVTWPGKYASSEWLYHVVYFRRERKDIAGFGESTSFPAAKSPSQEAPVMRYQQQPVYPFLLQKEGLRGTVWIKTLVTEKGNVDQAAVSRSCGVLLLDNAALLAAYNNKFLPARINKKPVPVWVTYKVEFKFVN